MGMAVLGGAGFALFSITSRALAVGVLVSLVAVLVADIVMSHRVIGPTKITMVVLKSRSSTLDGLKIRAVPIAGAFEGLEVAVGTLGTVQRGEFQHIETRANQLTFKLGRAGSFRFIPFTLRHSSLGFVTAAKGFVQITPTSMAAIGATHDGEMEAKASSRSVELERLREYVPGDRPNHVHWMASAKTGQLQVRDDLWQQDEMVIVIQVDKKETLDGERPNISFIMGLARLAIERGWEAGFLVRVITFHESSDTLLVLAERAAVAVDKAMPQGDLSGRPAATLRNEYVSDESELVERLAGVFPAAVPRPNGPHYVVSREGLWLAE